MERGISATIRGWLSAKASGVVTSTMTSICSDRVRIAFTTTPLALGFLLSSFHAVDLARLCQSSAQPPKPKPQGEDINTAIAHQSHSISKIRHQSIFPSPGIYHNFITLRTHTTIAQLRLLPLLQIIAEKGSHYTKLPPLRI